MSLSAYFFSLIVIPFTFPNETTNDLSYYGAVFTAQSFTLRDIILFVLCNPVFSGLFACIHTGVGRRRQNVIVKSRECVAMHALGIPYML